MAQLVELLDERAPDAVARQLAAIVTPRVVTSHANLRALANVDDPRLARWAIDALVGLPFTGVSAQGFLEAIVDTVARLRDPRITEAEEAIRTAVTTRIGRLALRLGLIERVAATIASLPAVPAATAAELALEHELGVLLEPLRRPARSAEALLAEIYANPTDDAPRLVYADLLLERGDPRGELIMLQLERGDGSASARELELLKQHGKAWLGPLAPALSWGRGYSDTRFRRGFVATADIILSVGKKLEPIRANPAWATVEELAGTWDLELLYTAPLRALRVIDRQLGAATIARIATRTEPLSRVTDIRIAELGIDPAILRAAFPALATVRMYWRSEGSHDLERLGRLGVERVVLTHNFVDGSLASARAELAAYVHRLVGSPAPMARLALQPPYLRGDEPPLLELRRDARGRFELAP